MLKVGSPSGTLGSGGGFQEPWQGRRAPDKLGVEMSSAWSKWRKFALGGGLAGAALAVLAAQAPSLAQETIKIGQVAALSGASAQSGEAITRGLTLAIDEINAKGGLLGGRMLELVQRDDESNPPKGLIAARELDRPRRGGGALRRHRHAGVAGHRAAAQQGEGAYMGVWAAGTGITRNGANPNYVFRVSAVDVLVDVRLLALRAARNSARRSPA